MYKTKCFKKASFLIPGFALIPLPLPSFHKAADVVICATLKPGPFSRSIFQKVKKR